MTSLKIEEVPKAVDVLGISYQGRGVQKPEWHYHFFYPVRDWMLEHKILAWIIGEKIIFLRHKDAIAFKLRWG